MPYAKEWLDVEAAMGGRAQILIKGSPEEIKTQYGRIVAALTSQMPPPPENSEELSVVEGEVNETAYRIYAPTYQNGPFPTFIWMHGGGLMLGDLNEDDHLCRIVAEHTRSAIISVDYHLSPEYKWPTQLNDVLKVYKWAHANASSYNLDPTRFYTFGGSAGALLALAAAKQILRDPELKSSLSGIVALCAPTTHFDNCPPKYQSLYKSFRENEKDVPLNDKESLEIFYHEANLDPANSDCFVILAEDQHRDFPPTYFVSCEYDPLRDDTYVLKKALEDAGVRTKHDHYHGLPHYFWIFPGLPQGQIFVEKLIAGVTWLLSQ